MVLIIICFRALHVIPIILFVLFGLITHQEGETTIETYQSNISISRIVFLLGLLKYIIKSSGISSPLTYCSDP